MAPVSYSQLAEQVLGIRNQSEAMRSQCNALLAMLEPYVEQEAVAASPEQVEETRRVFGQRNKG